MAIPTNLITGFLGVGKSTAIVNLLQQAPANEYWAVLVNEFGEVGIDGAMIESRAPASVSVREVQGGCICCSAGLNMQVTLARLLRDKTPDRLIIEPTGLGHPAGIIDSLRRPPLSSDLELRATICLVDPREFSEERLQRSEVYLDQLNLADVLVITKTDLASEQQIETFARYARGLYPAKTLIARSAHGQLDPLWLDLLRSDARRAEFPDAHQATITPTPALAQGKQIPFLSVPQVISAEPDGQHNSPGRYPSSDSNPPSCGWIFPPNEVFSRVRLKGLLATLGQPGPLQQISRAKGVIRTGKEWQLFNATCDGVEISAIAWRRDSRLELLSAIADAEPDWLAIEAHLNALIVES